VKLYLAGTLGIISREKQCGELYKRRLLSYWDISQNQFAVPEAFFFIKARNLLARMHHQGGNREK